MSLSGSLSITLLLRSSAQPNGVVVRKRLHFVLRSSAPRSDEHDGMKGALYSCPEKTVLSQRYFFVRPLGGLQVMAETTRL
jgi:hypothetical protein